MNEPLTATGINLAWKEYRKIHSLDSRGSLDKLLEPYMDKAIRILDNYLWNCEEHY